jgi:hypothetical protein
VSDSEWTRRAFAAQHNNEQLEERVIRLEAFAREVTRAVGDLLTASRDVVDLKIRQAEERFEEMIEEFDSRIRAEKSGGDSD